jgi:hypothetical protein
MWDGKLVVVLVRRGLGSVYGGELVPHRRQDDSGPPTWPQVRCPAEAEEEIGLTDERVELLAALPAAETGPQLLDGPFLTRLLPRRRPGRARSGRFVEVVLLRTASWRYG